MAKIGSSYHLLPVGFFNRPKIRRLTKATEGIGALIYLAIKDIIIQTGEPLDEYGIETISDTFGIEESEVKWAIDKCCEIGILKLTLDENGKATYSGDDIEEEIENRKDFIESKRQAGLKSAEKRKLKALTREDLSNTC